MSSPGWKVRFFTIWTGQALSLVGSALVQFALIWWLTETSGSAKTLAAASSIGFLPTIFLGPFAGTLVDRWHRKWVLIVSDGLIALATALLALLFWLGVAQPWHVFVILFVRSLGDCFQGPAMMSTTPLMVPKDQLTRVAGMDSTLWGVVTFAAPPLGALLLALVDVQGILPLDVVTAVVAIVPLLFVPIPQPAVKAATGTGLRSVSQGLGEGLRYMWTRPGLRLLMATSGLSAFTIHPMLAFMPLLVTGHFGGGALELGWLQSAFGIGQVAGGILLSAWGGWKRHMATSLTGTFGFVPGVLLVAIAPANALWLALVGWAIVGVMSAPHNAGARATRQIVVRPEVQGRVFAVWRSIFTAMAPLVLLTTSPLVDLWGVRPFWFVGSAITLAVALIQRFTPTIYYIEDRPDVGHSEEE
jgi:DHA3 family macrolide efflux protein-like MFS transporter